MTLVLLMLGLVAVRLLPGRRGRRPEATPHRLVLVHLLVGLRAGQSVLGALQSAAAALPDDRGLSRVARVATVSGLLEAVPTADDGLRPVIVQLARAQRSGAPLAGTVRRLIDDDLAERRAARLARARSLPTRLMVPVTVLMLPGLVLLLYAPALMGAFTQLTGGTWQ
jgi:hypothetical protein